MQGYLPPSKWTALKFTASRQSSCSKKPGSQKLHTASCDQQCPGTLLQAGGSESAQAGGHTISHPLTEKDRKLWSGWAREGDVKTILACPDWVP